jgi:hypothetical protein
VTPSPPSNLPQRPRRCLNPLLGTPSYPPTCTYCTHYIPCTSPAVDPPPSPTVDSATPVSFIDETDTDITGQAHHLIRDALRVIWHHRPGHIRSHRVSDMHKYAIGVPTFLSPPISLESKMAGEHDTILVHTEHHSLGLGTQSITQNHYPPNSRWVNIRVFENSQ